LKLEADHETLTPIIIIAIDDGAPSDDLEPTIRIMAEDSIISMPSRGRLGFVFSRSATIQARLRLFSVETMKSLAVGIWLTPFPGEVARLGH